MTWQRGDRVWYEPSPGLRFAGVVVGEGSLPGCYQVLLTGHYYQWKSSHGQREPFRHRLSPAISGASLTRRDGSIPSLDDIEVAS